MPTKQGKKNRKFGRNKEKCALYLAQNRRERNKRAKTHPSAHFAHPELYTKDGRIKK